MLSIRVLKPKVVCLFKIAFCNEGKVEIKLVPVNFLGFFCSLAFLGPWLIFFFLRIILQQN